MIQSIPLTKLRFRFLEEEDIAQYGGDWFVMDEKAITRRPARELIVIEKTIGMSVLHMFLKYRMDDVEGRLAGMWVARKLSGIDEKYDTFNPLALAVDWEWLSADWTPEVPMEKPEGDVDPPAENSSTTD